MTHRTGIFTHHEIKAKCRWTKLDPIGEETSQFFPTIKNAPVEHVERCWWSFRALFGKLMPHWLGIWSILFVLWWINLLVFDLSWKLRESSHALHPMGSMYGISFSIYHKKQPHVGIHIINGPYGYRKWNDCWFPAYRSLTQFMVNGRLILKFWLIVNPWIVDQPGNSCIELLPSSINLKRNFHLQSR